MNNKIAIVTGCMGFLAKYLVEALLRDQKNNWQVYGYDKKTYVSDLQYINSLRHEYPNKFRFVEGDICDLGRIPQCDVIFNLAAESHVSNSIRDSKPFIKTNVEGVANLLDLIKHKQDKPLFFHVSTDEVYGDILNGAFKEDDLLNPSNPYSASKAAGDMMILSYARTHGIEYNIVRPTNFFGHMQYPEKLIPLSINYLFRGKRIKLHDLGEPKRNWLHVDDAIRAFMTILESGDKNTIYNIAGDNEIKNLEVVKRIVSYINSDPELIELEDQESRKYMVDNGYIDLSYSRQGQDERYALDDSRMRSLGWEPEIKFENAIKDIIEAQKYLTNSYWWGDQDVI